MRSPSTSCSVSRTIEPSCVEEFSDDEHDHPAPRRRRRKHRMSKADTLRLDDVRSAYRLIGDCRDLGAQPALWYRRMLEGLYLLFGVLQAAGGEGWWERPGRPVEPISAYSVSGEPGADEALRAYHRDGQAGSDPIFQAIQ